MGFCCGDPAGWRRRASVFYISSIHSLHPRKEQEKRCSAKLTCTVQMDTPSFLTRRLRKLKKYAPSRQGKNARFSSHAVPKNTVSFRTHIYAWQGKLNHKKQSNGWGKRQFDASLWQVQKWLQTFMGLSISPPHRDCRGIRKGFQVGFKLFFTTW